MYPILYDFEIFVMISQNMHTKITKTMPTWLLLGNYHALDITFWAYQAERPESAVPIDLEHWCLQFFVGNWALIGT